MRCTVCDVTATPDLVRLVLSAPHVPSILPVPGAEVALLEDGSGDAEAVALALEAVNEITSVDDLAEIAHAVEQRLAQVRAELGQLATGEADAPGSFGTSFGNTEGL